MNKVRNIRQSMSCYTLSLVGLLPLLGLPWAALAAFRYWNTVTQCSGWNPARRYLVLGGCLGGLGILCSIIELIWLGMYWVNNSLM